MLRALLAAAILLVPLAAAANPLLPPASQSPSGNNETAPSVGSGNDGHPVGPSESTESAPGVAYGVLVLVGTLAFAGVLAWVSWRYARRQP
jgi:hypothetical protein